MFKELEIVILNHPIKKYGLEEGSIGTVVDVYKDKKKAVVEFMDDDGKTIAVIDLDLSEVKQNNIKSISKSLKSKNTYEKSSDYRSFVIRDQRRKTH